MTTPSLSRTFLHAPPQPSPPGRLQKLVRQLAGALLSPAYWLLAHRYRTPGLQFHLLCAQVGLGLIYKRKAPISYGWSFHLMFLPMDSTRYFEFDFMWRALPDSPIGRYLDVSSPRLFPMVVLNKKRALSAELINPDTRDLDTTAMLIEATGLDRHCHLHNCSIGSVPFEPEAFDVITSISVIEHIPQDTQAIQKMWNLLKPGGRLLVSVPCAAVASEQYIDHNEYGLLTPNEQGFVFWQRFYDQSLLQERILSVTGQPNRSEIYGEKTTGAFQKNAARKRAEYTTTYPFWREPYMMGQEYDYFENITRLPGEGVIAMEFIKR